MVYYLLICLSERLSCLGMWSFTGRFTLCVNERRSKVDYRGLSERGERCEQPIKVSGLISVIQKRAHFVFSCGHQLYKRLCLSIYPSVSRSVGQW